MSTEANWGTNRLTMWTVAAAYVAWVVMLRVDVGGELADTLVTLLGPFPLAAIVLALEDPGSRPIGWLRGVLSGVLPGLAVGLLLGLALRVGMRVVAMAAGLPLTFTIPGTVTLLVIGAVFGASYGALLTAVWRSMAVFHLAPGRIAGTALAVWFWYPFFLAGSDDLAGLVAMPLILVFTTLLSALWIGYGALLAATMRRCRSLPVPSSDRGSAGAV